MLSKNFLKVIFSCPIMSRVYVDLCNTHPQTFEWEIDNECQLLRGNELWI